MTENNNNQNEQPTEEQQLSNDTQIELREISEEDLKKTLEDQKKWLESEEELKKVLEDHKKWVESDGKEGKMADLVEANLQEAKLYKANLQKAKLENANLQNANLLYANLKNAKLKNANLQNAYLSKANLKKAYLYRANLQEANLYRANLQKAYLMEANLQDTKLYEANLQRSRLRGANLLKANFQKTDMQKASLDEVKNLNKVNLHYANLEGATGLIGNEFAQADVTGTKLPDDIKEFKALETVKETSQNARKIFFAMLLGCVYSWLTIATTTDVRLLTNTASSPLPIIGTEIPIAWFYIAAPLVLICLYFYFHLYLLKLWEGLASLPAIFPDGKRLDERAYPWLLNGLVRRHFRLLKLDRPFISHIQEWITIFLAWWVVPITMIGFWLRFIPSHDWWGSCFHIGLIVVSVAFAIIFYRLCSLILRRKVKVAFRLNEFWRDSRFYYGVSVVAVGSLLSLLSYGAINGTRNQIFGIQFYGTHLSEIVPWAFKQVGYDVFANLGEKNVSEIPDNYGQIAKEERLKFVKGAKLDGRNFNFANMCYAFLVKASLSKALLKGAFLMRANLQEAILMLANMHQANLREANLHLADLSFANLQQANLREANLQLTFLRGANLKQAFLFDADFQDADLTDSKNLNINQLSEVKTLYKANLDHELFKEVLKCCPHLLEKPKEENRQKR